MKKHIYIYSPSGAVRDKTAFQRGIRRLQSLGYAVEIDPDALTSYQRFAGDDACRLAAIHRAAASRADVALITRGGYGLTRILDSIHYGQIAKAIEAGTQFVGISDFTAFQSAVFAKTGCTTWAGPALCEGFGVGGLEPANAQGKRIRRLPDDIMEDCFHDMALGQGEGSGWRQHLAPAGAARALQAQAQPINIQDAVLWGGNLSVLVSLLGTPYFPRIEQGVLFLEDIAEHPYRIERMLTQLLHAGVLAHQKAIIFGQFTGYQLHAHDQGFSLHSVKEWLQSKVTCPIVDNLPYGHVQTKVLLPVGATVDLLVEGRDALLLWGHAV